MQHYYHDGVLVEGIECVWHHRNGNCDEDTYNNQSFVNPFQFEGGKYTVMGCSWDSEPAYGVRCFETETGKIKWDARLLENVPPSSTETGDYYFFKVYHNEDYAYFARSKYMFVPDPTTEFWKVDLKNGNIVWFVVDSVEWNQGRYGIHLVDDDYLYFTKCREIDGHVANIWRMRTSDGVSELFYSEPPVPPYNQYKMYTATFAYNGKQYHFLYKQDLVGGTDEKMRFDFTLSLLEGSTKQVLWTWKDPSHHSRSQNIIYDIAVHNGSVVMFFEKSCRVFDMEKLDFERDIKILPPVDTTNNNLYFFYDHLFYNNYMIVRTSQWVDDPKENYPFVSYEHKPRSFQIIDFNTGRFIDPIPLNYLGRDGIGPYADYNGQGQNGFLNEIDGIIYYSDNHYIQAYDLNQLKRLMAIFKHTSYGYVAPSYKTSKGDVLFLLEAESGDGGVYCFKSPFSKQ